MSSNAADEATLQIAMPRRRDGTDPTWRIDLGRALAAYVVTRTGLALFVWLTGQYFTRISHGLDRAFFPENILANALFQWDAFQYANLAEKGYYRGEGYDITIGFFPGFPLAAIAVGKLVGSKLWGGIVVNHLASIAGAFTITRLCRRLNIGERKIDDEAVARETTLFWLASPLTLFFCVYLSESLFAFESALVLWAVAAGAWPVALLAGICATGTRNAGVIVVGAAALLAFERRREVKVGVLGWACIALMPLGLAGFCYYQQRTLGDGFAWMKAQLLWDRYLVWPWRTLIGDWSGQPGLGRSSLNERAMYYYQEVLALALTAPLFFLHKRLNLPWAVLALGVLEWLLALSSNHIISAARYQSANLYFALAIPAFLAPRPFARGLVWMLFGMVLAWYASTFPYGQWAS